MCYKYTMATITLLNSTVGSGGMPVMRVVRSYPTIGLALYHSSITPD